jgi:transcriptional repressor NrdR
MKCPYCTSTESQVKDSRPNEEDGTIRRRRICSDCGAKFTTIERVQIRDLSVRKNNGDLEPFDYEKLKRSVKIACRKRNIPEERFEKLVMSIHRRLETETPDNIIPSMMIGEYVSDSLINLDPIAFVRFVSVYKKFSKISDFKKIIAQIPEPNAGDDVCDLPEKLKTSSLF